MYSYKIIKIGVVVCVLYDYEVSSVLRFPKPDIYSNSTILRLCVTRILLGMLRPDRLII